MMPSPPSIDRGRSSVYAAELAAFEGTSYEAITPFDELLVLGRLVTDAAWWPCGETEIVPARVDACSSSTRRRGAAPPVVRLAADQMTPATVLHELAHVLAGLDAGHGPSFRRAHLDLVGFAFGAEPAEWLDEAYRSMSLDVGHRRWARPSERPGSGPIAL
ncbi:MAG: hypothetical protein ACO307_15390 [Ilumatobacteraceae bacterium]